MATEVTMPKLGLTMKTGTMGKWLKNEGDKVKKGDAIAEVMTEKITNKIEATADGVLLKIVAQKGEKLPIDALLAVIGEEGEDISAILAAAPAAPADGAAGGAPAASGKAVKISPAARKLAEENGLEIKRIKGTGPQGRITKDDVEKAIAEGTAVADTRPADEVIPYEGMRKAIGDNMANSWVTNAKVTHHVSVDMSGLLALRKKLNANVKDRDRISVTALLTKAVARALEIKKFMNATLDGEEIKILTEINIGMAVAVPDGLIVPVIHNADKKSVKELNTEINDLAKRGRRNKLNPDEMVGATFTITNLGGYGSVDAFTPIINLPESAILGVCRTVERPVVVDGQIVIRPMMGLSLSFDHRITDGAPAAEFLKVLIDVIENPYKIFV